MANKDHVGTLNGGSATWDQWRNAHRDQMADLSGAELTLGAASESSWNLSGCLLSGCTIKCAGPEPHRIDCSGADLSNARVAPGTKIEAMALDKDSRLDGAQFADVTLIGIDFSKVVLKDVSFFKSTLRSVTFRGGLTSVNFGRAKLSEADLADSHLLGCSLLSADVTSSKFDGFTLGATPEGTASTLENALFTSCSFLDAKLGECEVKGTQFIDCDLRRVTGLELDDTVLRGTVMSPGAGDDWSVLRRSYTGANMVFNLIALVVFFLPWIFEALYWVGVNQVQSSVVKATTAGEAALAKPQRETILAALHSLANPEFERCLRPPPGSEPSVHAACRPIWQVLLGAHEGGLALALSLTLLVYNVARLALTWLVAPLRDEERRSWYAPPRGASGWQSVLSARGHYGWMMYLHKFVKVATWRSLRRSSTSAPGC